MGLKKKTAVATATKQEANGTNAAIDRLKSAKPTTNGTEKKLKKKFKLTDQEKGTRGKVQFGCFNAALSSPAIAGMQFNTMDEYLELVKQAADAGVAYSFQD